MALGSDIVTGGDDDRISDHGMYPEQSRIRRFGIEGVYNSAIRIAAPISNILIQALNLMDKKRRMTLQVRTLIKS